MNARCGAGGTGGGHGAAVMETGDHNLDVKTRRNRETDRKTEGRADGRTDGRTDRRINISSRATGGQAGEPFMRAEESKHCELIRRSRGEEKEKEKENGVARSDRAPRVACL